MNEYISKEEMLKNLEVDKANNAEHCEPLTIQIMDRFIRYIREFPATDVQPLSVVAEHIKKRLYETAFNTTEAEARNAIADMAGRIDFWINELRGGDTNG